LVHTTESAHGPDLLLQFGRQTFERTPPVGFVPLVGKEILVLGISDEKEAEKDSEGHLVGFGQLLPIGLLPAMADFRQALSQAGNYFAIDAFAEIFGQIASKALGLGQELIDEPLRHKGVGGKEHP
jgi:hypothetical protein